MAAVSIATGGGATAWLLFTLLLSGLTAVGTLLITKSGRRSIIDPLYFQVVLETQGCLAGALALLCGSLA